MTEEQLHRSVADFLRVALFAPSFMTTFPAGGGGKVRGAKLKAMGLKAGMPDVMVFAQDMNRRPVVIGIELKGAKGRVSEAQRETLTRIKQIGFAIYICRSLSEVIEALNDEGIPLRARGT